MTTKSQTEIDGNQVYANQIGIVAGGGGYFNAVRVHNNLVYDDVEAGIVMSAGYAAGGVRIVSNTVS